MNEKSKQSKYVTSSIRRYYNEYVSARNRNDWWTAITDLSYTYNLLNFRQLSNKTKHEWLAKTIEVEVTDEILLIVKEKIVDVYKRIKHIISIGSRFNDDELLLVIVLHIELACVRNDFSARGFKYPEIDLETLMIDIKEIGNRKENRKDYRSAISQLRQNNPLPIDIEWLSLAKT